MLSSPPSPLTHVALSIVALAGVLALAPAAADAAVWEETRTWDQVAEDEYASWIESSFNEDIFTAGDFKDTATDCADAAYFARLIFAYENKLPFVISATINGKRISNRMSDFDHLPEDKRLRGFMRRVADNVSTATIGNDTYPVEISRRWVRPGGVWSRPRLDREGVLGAIASIFSNDNSSSSGHVTVIKRIEPSGVIWMIESTVPRAVRELALTSNLHFLPEKGKSVETGLRSWRQPQDYAKPLKALPGYSEEQFTIGIDTRNQNFETSPIDENQGPRTLDAWRSEVYARLAAGRTENVDETAQRLAQNFCLAVRSRVGEVNRALARIAAKGGRCLSESEYDNYSTPSRDRRAREVLNDLISLKTIFNLSKESAVGKVRRFLDACGPLEIAQDQTMTLAQFALLLKEDKVSSDPNDPLEARWGLRESLQRDCPRPADD